ncbi:MAG: guanylate kinase [Anaerolineae bacterium]
MSDRSVELLNHYQQTVQPILDEVDGVTGLPSHVLQPHPLLIVISGPSGVGKDSVLQRMKEREVPFHFVVTATDRPRRPNEVHGRDYLFVSTDVFETMIRANEMLEHAVVYDHYKGIPKQQVRDAFRSGLDVVLRIDVQGAETIKRLVPDALLIFLAASDLTELMERLIARKTETAADLAKRMATAQAEMKKVDLFDYVVINRDDRLDETVDLIASIVAAEHARVHPRDCHL